MARQGTLRAYRRVRSRMARRNSNRRFVPRRRQRLICEDGQFEALALESPPVGLTPWRSPAGGRARPPVRCNALFARAKLHALRIAHQGTSDVRTSHTRVKPSPRFWVVLRNRSSGKSSFKSEGACWWSLYSRRSHRRTINRFVLRTTSSNFGADVD